MSTGAPIVELFLEGAAAVAAALADPDVAARWSEPSALEDQTIGSLAGHLARGAVWLVDEYLGDEDAAGPVDFDSAADYFVGLLAGLGANDHQAIRDRGEAIAAAGHAVVVAEVDVRLAAMAPRLRAAPPDRLLAVAAGKVLRLEDYLPTRVVEQAVHLDDLARSLQRDPFPYPEAARALAIEVAMAMAVLRSGSSDVVRALYRAGHADGVIPVL